MEFSENFTNFFASETTTEKASVPIIGAAQKYLKETSGIGTGIPVFPTMARAVDIDLTKKLPEGLPSEEQMTSMPFNDLKDIRVKHSGNRMVQNYVAPYEHRAMTREIIPSGSVLSGLINTTAQAAAIPVYSLAKSQKLLPEDVDTSQMYGEEMKQAFIGIGEGLQALFGQQEEVVTTPVKEKEEESINSLVKRLIQAESSGRHQVDGELLTSSAGAKGITQVMPRTAKNPGYGIKPLQNETKEEYIRFGTDYLKKMISIFDSVEHGVAAYNAGPGAIHRAVSKANRTGKDWKTFIPKETQEYVEKVAPKKKKETVEPHEPQITDVMGFRG